MTSPKRAARGATKLANAIRAAETNGRTTGEMTLAAGEVFAKRMALGAHAMFDPINADHAEFARILPEKAKAFSEAGMTWLKWSGDFAERMADFAAAELATAADVTAAMAGCSTPASVLAVQSDFVSAWFSRAMTQSIALGYLTTRSHGAAMAPVHRAVKANASRLSR